MLAMLGLTFFAASVAFLLNERSTAEPIAPLELWRRPLLATSNAARFLSNMSIAGFTIAIPLYIQGVLGRSPEVAGFTLTTFMVGFIVSLPLLQRFYRVFGIRASLRTGGLLITAGAMCLLFLSSYPSFILIGAACFLMGFGIGPLSTMALALVQSSVEPPMRGSATASLVFSASLGATIGAAAIAALLNVGIERTGSGELSAKVHNLLNERSGLTALSHDLVLRSAFGQAIHYAFWGIAGLAALTLIAIYLIPGESELTERAKVSA